ncbi:nicotinate phosphoribosyltransferase [Candidatus Venteria ishoeyi]|uniref:Nicotinate phosphoribosyltransferase n=1 Tax=Candidatus Venteria ishoeyi TaxID=1899563 RepID=A0A1H6F6Y8_9GAMM|nr:nicotinate phosphoribosyltransferase [Candidatus Venteria ishoeyi]
MQVYRFQQDNIWLGDVLVNELDKPQLSHIQWQNFGEQNLQTMPVGAQGQALLQPVMHTGKIVYQKPTLPEIQAYAKQQRLAFQQQQTKKPYPVGLETNLLKLKQKLMQTNN